MDAATRRLVRARASRRCEYCRIHEEDDPLFAFHIEHIIPKKHGGEDDPQNLAWSCHNCNLGKGPNLAGREKATGKLIPLFHPRRQKWTRHFRWEGAHLVGKTKVGWVTIHVLNLNASHRLALREILIAAGVFPPQEK